ncbi:hypothetical protein HUJ04_005119 [Dendroctonus ponderosae]|nr:hypothetical protein HUJ04_005119 [Dendroctonus ponderosae]KAH1015449.1 hypothetical protein HUJ05_013171 [Dendroctonus ponderosae]
MGTSETSRELKDLYLKLQSDLDSDKRYWIRNDAKLKAVVTSKSYDEFREIVEAAHLKPLSKEDCKKKAAQCASFASLLSGLLDDVTTRFAGMHCRWFFLVKALNSFDRKICIAFSYST